MFLIRTYVVPIGLVELKIESFGPPFFQAKYVYINIYYVSSMKDKLFLLQELNFLFRKTGKREEESRSHSFICSHLVYCKNNCYYKRKRKNLMMLRFTRWICVFSLVKKNGANEVEISESPACRIMLQISLNS